MCNGSQESNQQLLQAAKLVQIPVALTEVIADCPPVIQCVFLQTCPAQYFLEQLHPALQKHRSSAVHRNTDTMHVCVQAAGDATRLQPPRAESPT